MKSVFNQAASQQSLLLRLAALSTLANDALQLDQAEVA